MATAELTVAPHCGRWLPAGLRSDMAFGLSSRSGRRRSAPRRSWRSSARSAERPPAHSDCALAPTRRRMSGMSSALAAHNLPIAAWPLLLGVLGAHRHRLGPACHRRRSAGVHHRDTLPVGAALGAYGAALLPYLPHLPLEWAGLALGASAWLCNAAMRSPSAKGLGAVRADRRACCSAPPWWRPSRCRTDEHREPRMRRRLDCRDWTVPDRLTLAMKCCRVELVCPQNCPELLRTFRLGQD